MPATPDSDAANVVHGQRAGTGGLFGWKGECRSLRKKGFSVSVVHNPTRPIEHDRTGLLVGDRGYDFVAAIRPVASAIGLRSRVSPCDQGKQPSPNSRRRRTRRDDGHCSRTGRGFFPLPEASMRTLIRGVRSLEFLDRTASRNNARILT